MTTKVSATASTTPASYLEAGARTLASVVFAVTAFPYVVSWAKLARIDLLALALSAAALYVIACWSRSQPRAGRDGGNRVRRGLLCPGRCHLRCHR
ncbi:MAG: hypothetical protein JXA21_00105 [Anaerolineae bacterium]|nr:hypothetical protein [Anaerolineae bacterium]